MCVKLSFRDLNIDPCPSHLTSTYTYGVSFAPRVRGWLIIMYSPI